MKSIAIIREVAGRFTNPIRNGTCFSHRFDDATGNARFMPKPIRWLDDAGGAPFCMRHSSSIRSSVPSAVSPRDCS
jgi:hypothetical protein